MHRHHAPGRFADPRGSTTDSFLHENSSASPRQRSDFLDEHTRPSESGNLLDPCSAIRRQAANHTPQDAPPAQSPANSGAGGPLPGGYLSQHTRGGALGWRLEPEQLLDVRPLASIGSGCAEPVDAEDDVLRTAATLRRLGERWEDGLQEAGAMVGWCRPRLWPSHKPEAISSFPIDISDFSFPHSFLVVVLYSFASLNVVSGHG